MTRTQWVIRVCLLGLAALAFVLFLGACATQERFMTQEQDDEFRAKCQAGCVVLPNSLWQQIMQALGMRGT